MLWRLNSFKYLYTKKNAIHVYCSQIYEWKSLMGVKFTNLLLNLIVQYEPPYFIVISFSVKEWYFSLLRGKKEIYIFLQKNLKRVGKFDSPESSFELLFIVWSNILLNIFWFLTFNFCLNPMSNFLKCLNQISLCYKNFVFCKPTANTT